MITIDEFAKVEIRIGTILEANIVPDADRLLQLIFDFGPLEILKPVQDDEGDKKDSSAVSQNDPSAGSGQVGFIPLPELAEKYPGRHVRQIMSAIRPFIADPSELVGKQIAVCVNLEPRKFRGYESQGMILASGEDAETLSFLVPAKQVTPGSKIH